MQISLVRHCCIEDDSVMEKNCFLLGHWHRNVFTYLKWRLYFCLLLGRCECHFTDYDSLTDTNCRKEVRLNKQDLLSLFNGFRFFIIHWEAILIDYEFNKLFVVVTLHIKILFIVFDIGSQVMTLDIYWNILNLVKLKI